ncbi:MAG: PqqD family protein [Anaerolineae bacterium]|nr:PqqD family protein [Anaerolineae bacterium]
MTTVETNGIPEIVPGLIWRVVDDNMVVVSPEAGDVHVLSQTGSDIWQLLVDKKGMSEVESYLVDKYIVSHEQAHDDLAQFIQELRAMGLIR